MSMMALLAKEDCAIYSKWQKKMFLHEEFSDCTIWVKTSNSCTRFPCHRAILAASSEVFSDILRTTQEKCSIIVIEDLSPKAVVVILKYIYLGHIELKGWELVCDVLKAAVKFKIPQLIHHCEEYLGEKLTLQNVCYILEAAILNNSWKLKEISKILCCEAGFVILNTSSFQEVNLDTVKMILSISDLQIQNEMAAFKAAWDWALYQCCKEGLLVSDENIANKMSPLLEFIGFEFMSSEEIDSLPTAALDKFHEIFPQRVLGNKKEICGDVFYCEQNDRCSTDTRPFQENVLDTEEDEEIGTNTRQFLPLKFPVEEIDTHTEEIDTHTEEIDTHTEETEGCDTNIEQAEGRISHADISEKQNCKIVDKEETSHSLSLHLIEQRKVTFPLQLANYCKIFKAPVFLYRDISLKGNIILFRFSVNANVYLRDFSIIHYSNEILRKTLMSLHIYNKNGTLASFSMNEEGNMKMMTEKNLYHGETFTFHALDLLFVKARKEYTVEVNRSSGECDVTWPGTLVEKMRLDDVEISILSQRCYGLCSISFIEAS